jgi:hypothetical protein
MSAVREHRTRLRELVLGTGVLLCLFLSRAAIALEPCVIGTTLMTPPDPTLVDNVILRKPVMLGYGPDEQLTVVKDHQTITLTRHWNSEVPPFDYFIPGAPPKCVHWVGNVGNLPAGQYTAKWIEHDTWFDTYLPAGEFRFAVVAAVPLFGVTGQVTIIITLMVIGFATVATK